MITRDYSDKDLRAALGSSPPLEKMKMGHMRVNKAFASREDLQAWNKAIDDMARGTYSPAIIAMMDDAEAENIARAKASHGAGT